MAAGSIAPPPGRNILLEGSPSKAVLRLATPTVIAMLTQSIVNEVDIVFFSWLPCPESEHAQAALLPSLIILWLFGGSLSAISVGTQAMTARRFAQGKQREAGAVCFNAWFVGLLAALVFTALGYILLPVALEALIKVPEVRAAAFEYLKWRLLGIASMALTFAFKAFFDGLGKTHVHMISAIVMNAANIVLCLTLIFGKWGAPRLGIEGAGLAGFISTWIGLAIMVAWAAAPSYRKVFKPFAWVQRNRAIAWEILTLSVPGAVATVAVMSGFALFSAIVSHLDVISHARAVNAHCVDQGGAQAINGAATTIIVGILKLTITACLAFGTATATLVSQSLGEGAPDKAERFGWVSVRLGLVIFGVVGFLEAAVFPEQILSFVTQSPEVLSAALGPMRLMGICTPIMATGMILTQALFGAGNSRFVMIVELILHFTCLVPLAWILGITFELGLIGIWTAAAAYILLLAIVMSWKFRTGDWKQIHI
jgi:putative MATE family efflux protein